MKSVPDVPATAVTLAITATGGVAPPTGTPSTPATATGRVSFGVRVSSVHSVE